MNECPWCGLTDGHSEICEGFTVNDPAWRSGFEAEHRGRGRPRIGTRVELVIPEDDLGVLDFYAGSDEVSRAELIRRILRKWIDDPKPSGW